MAGKVDVLIGLQWGDEGKGKIVDCLSPQYNVIARFQGGPNAGHTLEFEGKKFVLHTIPSGIFQQNVLNFVGNGIVVDPVVFKQEIINLEPNCPWIYKNLIISRHAHIILPTHRLLDAAYEQAKGAHKIGSTLKGIGPAYTDKISRQGIRVGDLFRSNFKDLYKNLVAKHLSLLKLLNFDTKISDLEQEFFDACEIFKKFQLTDSNIFIQEQLSKNKKILAEGAQGSMLDIDFGSYPYVTSSNTISPGASIGLGISPQQIGNVIGIFKAYCTRVGNGPFPTELNDNTGEILRKLGHEFGSTTGRPRRCGWLDLVALKYAIQINGVNQLIITKSDVLTNFDEIKVAVEYKTKYSNIQHIPFNFDEITEPIYKSFKGWKTNIKNIKQKEQIPQELLTFINFIEDYSKIPIKIISVGPDRNENIWI